MAKSIQSRDLCLEHLPPRFARFKVVYDFATTFDGYAYAGGSAECAEHANQRIYTTISDIRCCLFAEVRRSYHFGEVTDDHLAYMHELIELLRSRLQD